MRLIRATILWVFCISYITGFGLPAIAQSGLFTGEITQGKVQARAGAGRVFYVVGQLHKGTQVQVEEVIFGWYKVDAPLGGAIL